MALRKRFALLTLICTVGALVVAPAAGAAGYPVPKPKGGNGTTKKPTKKIGTKLEKTSISQLEKGFKINVKFTKAGTATCTIRHASTKIASGSVTATKKSTKTMKITFNAAGQTFLKKGGAGKTVKITCVFKPKGGGKGSTSSATVKLG